MYLKKKKKTGIFFYFYFFLFPYVSYSKSLTLRFWNLEKLIINTYIRKILMIGDFNAKYCNWSISDTATPERTQLSYNPCME